MEIKIIKCSDGFFIQKQGSYHEGKGVELRFAGERVRPTWSNDWFKVSQIGLPVTRTIAAKKQTTGYRLKDEFAPTEALPKEVDVDFFAYRDGECKNPEIRGLYLPVEIELPETYEEVETEFTMIAEVEGELLEKSLNFPVYGKWASEGKNWKITNQAVKVSLIDEITLPKILQQEVPCELSSEDSYSIIRTYIKDNIDPKVAKISSDYDFCLSVEKRIPLSEKVEYRHDENAWSGMFGGRRKKPKFVTKYRTERTVKVYETAPLIKGKAYDKYPATQPFRGINTEDLKQNIDIFLEALMEEINRPLKDCPTCKGQGILEG